MNGSFPPPWVKRVALAIWNGMANAQRAILIACAAFVTALVFSEVWMRYIFHYPGMEVEEVAALAAFWLYFVGAIYGSYERSHIKAELVHLVIRKPRGYAMVRVITSLITLGLAVTMCYWGCDYFIWGITQWEVSRVLRWPMVYTQASIFIGALFMSFYFLVELVIYVRQVLGKAPIVMPYQER
ncbi:MAG TPA: TRAP transporter small permease [Dehalococcoidia bacterium]|jgi:TRAP-type C4-dicarboxylate transport system permease small subunit|nr:TRAP transporter small permease [Dehalococcoidia bacterium]